MTSIQSIEPGYQSLLPSQIYDLICDFKVLLLNTFFRWQNSSDHVSNIENVLVFDVYHMI